MTIAHAHLWALLMMELYASWALTLILWWPMPKNNLIWQLTGGLKMASLSVPKKQLVFFTRKYNFHKKKFYQR